jgi:hypothetical protein
MLVRMPAQRDLDDHPKAQILSFEGRMEVDCPGCGLAISQEGTFSCDFLNWECSCGAVFQTRSTTTELPQYRPE